MLIGQRLDRSSYLLVAVLTSVPTRTERKRVKLWGEMNEGEIIVYCGLGLSGRKSSIGEKVADAESIAGLQLAFARQTSFAARSFSCRELDFYPPIIWGASYAQQASVSRLA